MPPNFYGDVLFAHNALRWFVLVIGAVAALMAAFAGSRGRRPSFALRRVCGAFVGFLDVELLTGVVIYFISPAVAPALHDPHRFLSGESGFFGFAHAVGMIAAIGLANVGNVMLRGPAGKRRVRGEWAIVVAYVAVALQTPWWRPLVR